MTRAIRSSKAPSRGSVITIEPLRTLDEVARVRAVLSSSPRNAALFTLGVNTNLRATDLLGLTAAQVDWVAGQIVLREGKTGKKRQIPLQPRVLEALYPCIPADGVGLLFPSRDGGQLTLESWNHIIKAACRQAGLRGNYGGRTVRKTWAYLQYRHFGVDIITISMELNHASPRETYRYLCLTPPETARVLSNYI